jgi:hypothetical protein
MADAAELSSLSASIEEVRQRIGAIALRHEQPRRDDVLGPLYDAERSLRAAQRRVDEAVRFLR